MRCPLQGILPRMRFLPPLPLLLIVLLAAPGLGCGKLKPQAVGQPDPVSSTTSDTAAVRPIDAARLRTLVSDGRATATLVNVWATWCGPCREEFPAMLAVARRHRAEGLRLLLVSADYPDQLPAMRAFLEANGARDTCYLKDQADMSFINGVQPKWSGALPATLLYDTHGRLIEFWEGGADSMRFERAVTSALHAKGIPS
jgi:thiol-disulfide isomerase/thioredoxin